MEEVKDFKDVKDFSAEEIAEESTKLQKIEGGLGLQKIHTQYTTAVRVIKPRIIKNVLEDTKAEIEIHPEIMYYEWPVKTKHGKKDVFGGSIQLAQSIARNFGNCAVDTEVQETPTHHIFTAAFIDLQTGYTLKRAFKQRKAQNIGMKDTERAEDLTFQIGQSKALRNVILNAVPGSIVERCLEYAKKVECENISPEEYGKTKIAAIDYFREQGVPLSMLGEYLDQPDPDLWSNERVVKLRALVRSIRDGETTTLDVFGTVSPIIDENKKKTVIKKSAKDPKNTESIFTPEEDKRRKNALLERDAPFDKKTKDNDEPGLFNKESLDKDIDAYS